MYSSGESEEDKGGTGFLKLVEASRNNGVLRAEIVVVVSNHAHGGVFTKAQNLGIPFRHSPKGRTPEDHTRLVQEFGIEWTALSGWLGCMAGHDPKTTFNIHPAVDLVKFGGKGMFGHHVHEAVWKSFLNREITHTGVTMHFATEKYDDPSAIFFQRYIPLTRAFKNAETVGKVVNLVEQLWQAEITNRVVHRKITWGGKNAGSIVGSDIVV